MQKVSKFGTDKKINTCNHWNFDGLAIEFHFVLKLVLDSAKFTMKVHD